MRTCLEIEKFCSEQTIKNPVDQTVRNLQDFTGVVGFEVSYDQLFDHMSPRHHIHFAFDGDDFRVYRERVKIGSKIGRWWFARSYSSRNIAKRGQNAWLYTVNGRIDYSLASYFDEDMLYMKAFELDLK